MNGELQIKSAPFQNARGTRGDQLMSVPGPRVAVTLVYKLNKKCILKTSDILTCWKTRGKIVAVVFTELLMIFKKMSCSQLENVVKFGNGTKIEHTCLKTDATDNHNEKPHIEPQQPQQDNFS
ncbi:hypothetical protein HELRODRAFT_172926 [Helobdella robusta]|uniref:Uncharacterized protein n=1 Tax=Helobdella robusta TaxID=6412 RepID=T1F653_HELRO|nr:hypothetical protein HELRODRAFT_172926 [Helobdella robusta]ESO03898.1 hypothetical protein HELRODRAFT_172926 [Helobdella robusta]